MTAATFVLDGGWSSVLPGDRRAPRNLIRRARRPS